MKNPIDLTGIDWETVIIEQHDWITEHRNTTGQSTMETPDSWDGTDDGRRCKRGHPLTEGNFIWKSWHGTDGGERWSRECRECGRIRRLARKLEHDPDTRFDTPQDKQFAEQYLKEKQARRNKPRKTTSKTARREYCERGHPLSGENLETHMRRFDDGRVTETRHCRACRQLNKQARLHERNPTLPYRDELEREQIEQIINERHARKKR